MLTSYARLETARPSRYLVQLCRHASEMGRYRLHRPRDHGGEAGPPRVRHAEWSEGRGLVSFDFGRCHLRADTHVLTLRVEAADVDALRRMQVLLAKRLEMMGRRDRLAVVWGPVEPSVEVDGHHGGPSLVAVRSGTGRRRFGLVAGFSAVVMAVAVHAALVAGLLGWVWAAWLADVLLAVVVAKLIVVGIIGLRHLRSRPARGRDRR